MKLLELLAAFHNWLADKDFIWWPFSFLRPQPQEAITFRHTLVMTACFGGLTFVFFTVFAVMNSMFSLQAAFFTFISCFFGFLVWFNTITRPLWNVRANQLTRR